MADCIETIVSTLREAVNKYGYNILQKQWYDIKTLIIREYRVSDKCVNKDNIVYATSLLQLEKSNRNSGNVTLTISTSRRGFSTPGGGMFPEYSIAEALFVGLYQEDPVSAHEKMYRILEQVLLSEGGELVKKALFVPINDETWNVLKISENLVQFLEMIDEESRKEVCRALSLTFMFIPVGMSFSATKDKNTWYVNIDTRIFALCPEFNQLLRGEKR